MLITNDFEVPQPIDRVWAFFDDIPGVAACLPGAEITEELGPDEYAGQVGIRIDRRRAGRRNENPHTPITK